MATQDLMRSPTPNIPLPRLELDRAHRALGPPRTDGSPRDIIAKPHIYVVKEAVIYQARTMPQVICQGHPVQILADLSPSTIQCRRTLKPLLNALSQKDVKYRWAFPFAVKFTYKGQNQAFSNFAMGEKLLLSLKIISQEMEMETSSSGLNKRLPPSWLVPPLSFMWAGGHH